MKIVNIVATAKITDKFNLNLLSNIFRGSKFPSRGPWLMWRTTNNQYVAFYKSGKVLITGKSETQINKSLDEILKILKKSNINAKLKNFEIHNFVLTDKIELDKSLDDLFLQMDKKASFEPEQFPGLFYKDDENINITLFASGKLIITGAKDIKTAAKSLENFKKIIISFKNKDCL